MHSKIIISLWLVVCAACTIIAVDDNSTHTNEIIPREAIQRLDFSVRQALLRAIDKLEKEVATDDIEPTDSEEETTIATPPSTATSSPKLSASKDEILEESTNSADEVVPTVQFYTATFDEKNAQEQLLSSYIDRSKLWQKTIKKPSQLLVAPDAQEATTPEIILAETRSLSNSVQSNEISSETSDEIKFELRKSKVSPTSVPTTEPTTSARPPTTKRRTTTTSTTTTSTTPRPTHNEDGENIEVVDKNDIRIQEAPLVSAFTVDLDERGAAKKVFPIVHSNSQRNGAHFTQTHIGPTIAKLSVLPAGNPTTTNSNLLLPPLPTQSTIQQLPTTSTASFLSSSPTTIFNTKPQFQLNALNNLQPTEQSPNTNVNNFLIERQRQLEQQIYQLKLQAQHQQELILRQLKLLEEQSKLGNLPRPALLPSDLNAIPLQLPSLQTVPFHVQQPIQSQQQQQQTSTLTIRPSIEFIPSTQTKSPPTPTVLPPPTFPIDQQLPLKDNGNKFNNNHAGSSSNINSIFANQQRVPINPVQQVFQNLQKQQAALSNQSPSPASTTTVQIQPSTQFNFAPTFSTPLARAPLELSLFQAPPQHNFQQFQQSPLVPSYVNNALFQQQQQQQQQQQHQQHQHQQQQQQQLQQQQQQQQDQQQQRARLFRNELGTGNFGLNQVEIQPSTSFTHITTTSIVDQTLPQNQQQHLKQQQLQEQQQQQHLKQQQLQEQQQQQQQLLQQQQQQQQQQQVQQQLFENQNFYRQHLQPELSNQLQQNAQQFYQQQNQQQQQQQQKFPTSGNTISSNSIQALNHGISNFPPQTQNLRFNGGF